MSIAQRKSMAITLKKINDDQFKPLYEQAKKLPNVNYIGYKPNRVY